jgi:hypothetical protein
MEKSLKIENPISIELSGKFKEKALEELREDELRRNQALDQFRDWITVQRHIVKCRTGEYPSLAILKCLPLKF